MTSVMSCYEVWSSVAIPPLVKIRLQLSERDATLRVVVRLAPTTASFILSRGGTAPDWLYNTGQGLPTCEL